MKKLVLVDGNALLHRAYHATPPLSTSKGELVNAVYGFTAMILKVWDDLKPDYMAIAWDERGPTFRHQAYTQYKATRGPSDEGLGQQYPRVFEVCKAFNIPEFRLSGYEADDLIGTLAKHAEKEKNLETIIVTGDRDIMQLISPKIKVFMPKKTLSDVGLYGIEEFKEKFGFEPINLIDYKSLAGDASDNIPGVPGIGEVTAKKLVAEYKTMEEIYKKLEEISGRTKTLLAEGAESAVMSKKLATIDTSAPIKLDLKKCEIHDYKKSEVIQLFEELEFKSLINKLGGEVSDSSPVVGSSSKQTMDLDLEVDKVLQKMTKNGILVDWKYLERLGIDLKDKLSNIEKELYSKVGHEFNINSPKQLAVILFDDLNLPVFRKTKTGRSTDEETLRELVDAHPVVPLLLQYRQIFKLISTYIDALPKYEGDDHRIHSTFNVEGAATGRLSSTNPNLQNIPIRGELGAELRRVFIVPKDRMMLGADYSQIELRILADLAADEGLKEAFSSGVDIHSATAAKIFKIKIEDVSREQRAVGKTMNFAVLYGQGAHALSRQLGVDYKTAQGYIEEYFAQFPKVRIWKEQVLEEAYKNGYVETLWGRRRYIPELSASNKMLKSFGERAAINHPVQGTAADMIKRAMVDIDKVISQKEKVKSQNCKMILQVHDELLFECSPGDVEEMAKLVKDKMEHALDLSVPVRVEIKTGKNWGELKPL